MLEINQPVITIDQIGSRDEFMLALQQKKVSRRFHPVSPYEIWNYTKKTQYKGDWDKITTAARGLIVNYNTEEIIARPFSKFFNFIPGQSSEFLQEKMSVTEKLDGSLGICYKTPSGKLAIATRGSFVSEQALFATDLLVKKYPRFYPNPAWTYLFEIIYPQNKIIVDYGQKEALVLLGAIEIKTGKTVNMAKVIKTWPYEIVQQYHFNNFEEVLKSKIGDNKEGFVVHFQESDIRLKIKSENYLNLSYLYDKLSKRVVWEQLKNNTLNTFIAKHPANLQYWITQQAEELQLQYITLQNKVESEYQEIVHQLEGSSDIKQFAILAKDSPYRKYLFMRHNNDMENLASLLWEKIEPRGNSAYLNNKE